MTKLGFSQICKDSKTNKLITAVKYINIFKDKIHIIIVIYAEKAFHKPQQVFMIKVLESVGLKGIYLKIIKAVYEKPTNTIIPNTEKLEPVPLQSGQGCPPSLLLFNVVLKAPTEAVRQEDIKWLQTTKEATLSIYADDVVTHIKDPKIPAED